MASETDTFITPSQLNIEIQHEGQITMAHQFEPLKNDLIIRTAWGACIFSENLAGWRGRDRM